MKIALLNEIDNKKDDKTHTENSNFDLKTKKITIEEKE